MEADSPHAPEVVSLGTDSGTSAQVSGRGQVSGREVAALYETHALGLIRLAYVVLGDRPAAEDVVQEAFLGLYKRWGQLRDPASAPGICGQAS